MRVRNRLFIDHWEMTAFTVARRMMLVLSERRKSGDLHGCPHPAPARRDPRLESGRHLTSMPICQTSSRQTTQDINMCFATSTNGSRTHTSRQASISALHPNT